jgi:SAM-dependent methyltransferase
MPFRLRLRSAVANRIAGRVRHARMRAARIAHRGAAYPKTILAHVATVRAYCRPLETRRCPACASTRVALVDVIPASGRQHTLGTAFVSGCRACGLIFVNPLPSRASLDARYAPDGVWARGRTEPEPPDAAASKRSPYLRHLLTPVQDVVDITRPPDGAAVLDIGCGRGRVLDALEVLGWRTCGIDPSDKRAFLRHPELAAPPGEPTFHLIILHHVIEHVDAPLDLLRAAWSALFENGVLLVSVPRLDALSEHRDLKYCLSPSSHIVSYSRDCLYGLLCRAGFDPLDAGPEGNRTPDRKALRRLRMLGVKRTHSRGAIRRPLSAATRALAAFHGASGAGWQFRYVPTRVRALLLHRERRAGRSH